MTLNLTVDIDSKVLEFDLAQIERALGSPGEFFREGAVEWYRNRAEMRFDLQGDDASGKWAPLKYPTQQIRAFQGFGPTYPINIRFGDMRDWIMASPGIVQEGDATVRLVWPGPSPDPNEEQKFSTAQKGSKRKNTQARPVVAQNETDAAALTAAFASWLSARTGLRFHV